MHTQESSDEIQTLTHQNMIGGSMTAPPPVIAHQYSSAAFVSLHFSSCDSKMVLFHFHFLKLREFKLRYVGKYLYINPLNTKRRLLYLKTQFVPRSKHFSSRL